ncbi:hypothetical protein ACKWTF_010907 [Chironomus riparius]
MYKFLLLAAVLAIAYGQDRPIVTIPQGQLQGIRTSSGITQATYLAFKGIPYAEPPVGALRFRNPVAHRGWSGVRDASAHGNSCPSSGWFGLEAGGGEDCLFLNVYTQSLTANRPVMVWIHGGSFTGGSGDSFIYGPDFFINDGNVVVVTINYRLGVLGFLSTGDAAAQGNWGMKDMITALQWVRNNIASFGGNVNQITVFGESAGSVGVHYLLLTRLGTGLFNRAIMQSGVTVAPWGFQPNPLSEATNLGRRLGLTWSSTTDLVNQLRNIPPQRLVDNQGGWLDLTIPRGFSPFEFVPNVEPANSPESRFLTDTPVNIMNRGDILTMPIIIGFMSVESLFMVREHLFDDTTLAQFATNPHFYVHPSFNLAPTQTTQVNEVATTMRNMYFNGGHPTMETRFNYSQFMSDHHFAYSIDRCVRYHARRQTQPIYYYKFDFDGSLNMIKRLLLLTVSINILFTRFVSH